MKIRPVILSGGSGTRLWPISRRCFPKQFAPLVGDESLFAAALRTTLDRELFAPPIIVANVEHKFLILDALQAVGVDDARILLEPEGRNTGAAAITAALTDSSEDTLHLVMPSDHLIEKRDAFIAAVQAAASAAQAGNIVLFGMRPSYPETGYGYIVPGEKTGWAGIARVGAFQEKPDAIIAKQLIDNGALWNSGMFLYLSSMLVEETQTLAPEYLPLCMEALAQSKKDLGCLTLAAEPYAQIPSEPFDRLIMERTKRGCVIPCSIGWSDAGSWHALWQMSKHNDNGNVFVGPVVSQEVSDAYIRSDGPTVAVLGVRDIAVIATRDAVLIAPRNRAQDVKALVAKIERQDPALADHHMRVLRPWGTYESLAEAGNFHVKHIIVHPGRALSLQQHHHRAEHWIIVGGTAKVERDGVEELVFPNESVFVPRGAVHRLSNPGKIPLHLIEVQSGDYFGEDDILRFDDPYGRGETENRPVPRLQKAASNAA